MAILGVGPYLPYADADAAVTWMVEVLGFTDAVRWRDDAGEVIEAEVAAGSTTIGVTRRPVPPADALFVIRVDDVDAEYARVSAGAWMPVAPPEDQPYGPRTFTIRDPGGYRWTFWQGRANPPEPVSGS